jgi:hypothetical protein
MNTEPCSRCIAELTSPAAQLQIRPTGDITAEEIQQISQDTWGPLPAKVALIRRALVNGWTVQVNAWPRAAEPVTTWQGDPICEPHLYEVWQASQQPQTVRMAQWKRR